MKHFYQIIATSIVVLFPLFLSSCSCESKEEKAYKIAMASDNISELQKFLDEYSDEASSEEINDVKSQIQFIINDSIEFSNIVSNPNLNERIALEENYLQKARDNRHGPNYDKVVDSLSIDKSRKDNMDANALAANEQLKRQEQEKRNKAYQQYNEIKNILTGNKKYFLDGRELNWFQFYSVDKNLSGYGRYGRWESDYNVELTFSYLGDYTILVKTYDLETDEKVEFRMKIFKNAIQDLQTGITYYIIKYN